MQARLQVRKSPSFLATALFALAAAATLGGGLGYAFKPAVTVQEPAKVVVLHDNTSGAGATGDNCVRLTARKAC